MLPPVLPKKTGKVRQSLDEDLSEQILKDVLREPQNPKDQAPLSQLRPDSEREARRPKQAEAEPSRTPKEPARKTQAEEIKELISPQKRELPTHEIDKSGGFDDLLDADLDLSAV